MGFTWREDRISLVKERRRVRVFTACRKCRIFSRAGRAAHVRFMETSIHWVGYAARVRCPRHSFDIFLRSRDCCCDLGQSERSNVAVRYSYLRLPPAFVACAAQRWANCDFIDSVSNRPHLFASQNFLYNYTATRHFDIFHFYSY